MDNTLNGQGIRPKNPKAWILRFITTLVATIWLFVVACHWADAASTDDEYSFNWLDPEKKIYVLQNRRYTKAKRLLLSLMAGPGISNSYRNSLNVDPRVAFYLSESFGVEAFYTLTSNSANNTYDALKGTGTTVAPVIREVKSQYGALLHWIPWYAKINMFNKILYFDWYLAGGAGTMQTVAITNSFTTPTNISQSLFTLFAATGHQYHLTHSFTVRLDFSGAFYRAPVFGTTGASTWFSNYNFVAGIGLRL